MEERRLAPRFRAMKIWLERKMGHPNRPAESFNPAASATSASPLLERPEELLKAHVQRRLLVVIWSASSSTAGFWRCGLRGSLLLGILTSPDGPTRRPVIAPARTSSRSRSAE